MATVTTAGKLTRRSGRKRNKINAIEKVMALKSLMDNPTSENFENFRRRYVDSSKRQISSQASNFSFYGVTQFLKLLQNLASKSMAWKFEIFCEFYTASLQGNVAKVSEFISVVSTKSKQANLSTSVLETRFVNPNRIERYDDKSRQKFNNMGRL